MQQCLRRQAKLPRKAVECAFCLGLRLVQRVSQAIPLLPAARLLPHMPVPAALTQTLNLQVEGAP